MYNKDHGITTMNRHVAFEYFTVLKPYNTQSTIINIKVSIHQTSKKWKIPYVSQP